MLTRAKETDCTRKQGLGHTQDTVSFNEALLSPKAGGGCIIQILCSVTARLQWIPEDWRFGMVQITVKVYKVWLVRDQNSHNSQTKFMPTDSRMKQAPRTSGVFHLTLNVLHHQQFFHLSEQQTKQTGIRASQC